MDIQMNKKRRIEIKSKINSLENIKSELESILSDEEYYFDNMPENLQGSLRGEESECAIDMLNEVIEAIDSCIENLNEIV